VRVRVRVGVRVWVRVRVRVRVWVRVWVRVTLPRNCMRSRACRSPSRWCFARARKKSKSLLL